MATKGEPAGDEADAIHSMAVIPKAGLAVIRDGRLLLCKARRHAELIMPGGAIEEGESPEIALHREVAEELGEDTRVVGPLTYLGEYRAAAAGRPGQDVNISLYLGQLNQDPVASMEIDSLIWYDPVSDENCYALSEVVGQRIIPALSEMGLLA